MAVFKLGAIVTGIKGSIGGTTFRTNGASNIMQNKSRGVSRNRLLLNPALNRMAVFFRAYSSLSDSVKEAWVSAALLYQFPDKFGTLKYLSARQLFIKLNSQLSCIVIPPPDPFALTSAMPDFTGVSSFLDFTGHNFYVTIDYDLSEQIFIFQVESSVQPLRAPTFIARKIFYANSFVGTNVFNIYPQFIAAFPNATAGQKYRVYVTMMTVSGFRSVTVPIDVIVL